MSDTVAALERALKPGGIQRIPLSFESYQHPSLPLSAKRLINLMAEQQPADARVSVALVSTPGLLPYQSVGTGPLWAINDDLPGRIYLISGTHAYRMYFVVGGSPSPVIDDLGDIGTPDVSHGSYTGFYTIAVGPTAVVFCTGPNAYTGKHGPGDPINQITDPAFPGASSVAYVDGYFGFSSFDNTTEWFISKLLDPTAFDALDFVFSDATPNVIRRIVNHRGQFWIIGESGFEVWYDSGDLDFPFRRASGGVIWIGTSSPMSVCRADKSVWWVGMDGTVYRSNGYTPQRVSTHAIEAIISTGVGDIHALTHSYRGHWFYCLTTSDLRTLCYDVTTGMWHERSTSIDGVGPWQASVCAMENNTIKLYGDRASPMLYQLGMQATDAGIAVLRQATLPPLWAGTKRAFCSRVEIEMEVGGPATPGPVILEWSDDGAHTWPAIRTMSAGLPAELRHRVYTTRLGSFRQRAFRVSTHGLSRVYAVDADITAGVH